MQERIHICFTFLGDIRFDSRLSKCVASLSNHGYLVSVIAGTTRRGENHPPGIQLISIPLARSRRALLRFLTYWLRGLIPAIRTKANCYFASDLYSLPLAFIASRITRAKLVYDSRELYSRIAALRDRRLTQKFWSFIERKIIAFADAVLTVNESLAQVIADRFHISKPTTLMNCPPRRTVQRTDLLRQLLHIPRTSKIILYQGGLQVGRGLFVALSVITRLHDCVLVFLGNGILQDEINRKIKNEKLEGRVFLLEAVPSSELLDYTASADLGLCLIENFGSSYYHSLPNKLFEYIAAGIPMVASDFPEISRIVRTHHVGSCVQPENEDDVVTAIERIISDRALYETLVSNCQKTADLYTWENEEVKLLQLIESLRQS